MPEPVLIAIAAAVAARAAGNLYDLVKTKFTGNHAATTALEAAAGAAEAPRVHELAAALEHLERSDPAFSLRLRAEWQRTLVAQHPESGGVANQVSGDLTGRVVQARDIHGDVSL